MEFWSRRSPNARTVLSMIVLQQGYKIIKDQETFKDVPKSGGQISTSKAIKEGIIERKNMEIASNQSKKSREEMAIIIAKVLKLKEVDEEIKFEDKGDLRKILKKINSCKIISGYPDGTFKPKQTLTRAESTAVVSKVIDYKKDEPTTGMVIPVAVRVMEETVKKQVSYTKERI